MNIYGSRSPSPPPEFGFGTLGNQSTAKSYEQCVSLIHKLDHFLGYFFKNLCHHVCPEYLQVYFDEKQIKLINHLLVWYYLFLLGHMPKNSGFDNSVAGAKKFLGIDNLLDLLNPERIETVQTNEDWLSFNDFARGMIEAVQFTNQAPYALFLKALATEVIKQAQAGAMIQNIKLLFDMDRDINYDIFEEPLNKLDQIQRIRWLFFVSIAASPQTEVDGMRELTEMKGNWFEKYYKPLCSLLILINLKLSKAIKPSKLNRSDDKKSWWQFATPITYAKSQPWQPNWMPNGGNTCPLSSTLWPLFLLRNDKILGKIPNLPEINNLRDTFAQLYLKVASLEIVTITKDDVNKFRSALQLSFPHHFIAPNEAVQEDAYEFLVCMMTDLLSLNSEKDAPLFEVLHTFERADDKPLLKPDDFNYAGALAPSFSREQSLVLDIRLDEGKKHSCHLKDLVTKPRQTENQERNAYRRAESQATEKYLSINATHTEQILVESIERAPDIFIGRLTRFTLDFTNTRRKRFDKICPDATLEFHVKGAEQQTIPYDLVAITVHSGSTIDAGHYFVYFRKEVEGKWRFYKWDDIDGPEPCFDEQKVLTDVSENGYIFYYKKRQHGEAAPEELRLFEEAFKPVEPMTPAPRIFLNDVSVKPKSLEEAKTWILQNCHMSFYVDEQQGYYTDLIDLVSKLAPKFAGSYIEERVMNAAASQLKRPIYLIDCFIDRNLQVLDNLYPIPGDKYRFGEGFHDKPLYLFVQKNGSYVELYRMEE